MARRMSNSERIARAAAEAKATADEKAVKKATKKTAKKTKKKTTRKKATKRTRKAAKPAIPVRMKVVWAVGAPGAVPTRTYPYKERAAADADAAKVGKGCIVKALRVPMEDPADEASTEEE